MAGNYLNRSGNAGTLKGYGSIQTTVIPDSFYRTLKYHAAYPGRFATIEQARIWMGDFIDWYNRMHRHTGLGYITPEQRRRGEDVRLFALRNETLHKAFLQHPERFPKGGPKMWKVQRVVYLNPSNETRKIIQKKEYIKVHK